MPNHRLKIFVIFLTEIGRNITNTKDYPFDKNSRFFVLLEEDSIKKTEEQLRKAKVIDQDPTRIYTNKSQENLCKLRKEKKFTDKEYFEIYPSGP